MPLCRSTRSSTSFTRNSVTARNACTPPRSNRCWTRRANRDAWPAPWRWNSTGSDCDPKALSSSRAEGPTRTATNRWTSSRTRQSRRRRRRRRRQRQANVLYRERTKRHRYRNGNIYTINEQIHTNTHPHTKTEPHKPRHTPNENPKMKHYILNIDGCRRFLPLAGLHSFCEIFPPSHRDIRITPVTVEICTKRVYHNVQSA